MSETICPTPEEIRSCLSPAGGDARAAVILRHAETCASCTTTLDQLRRGGDTVTRSATDSAASDLQSQETRVAAPAPPGQEAPIPDTRVLSPGALPDHVPRRLGEYQLEHVLGRGGMGVVYRAVHARLGKPVAVKVLTRHGADDPRWTARFARETQAIGRLNHPNIVAATDAGEVAGLPYLVMECLSGQDLDTLTNRRGPLPVADACVVIRQAALGLHHAHQRNLIHRDVKPSNLMLTPSGVVKVLDLGLARLGDAAANPDAHTVPGAIMGSVDYMAPEQAENVHEVDARADVYGLGCTLFKLLTGRAPYHDPALATVFQKLNAHATHPVPSARALRAEVPEGLDAVVRRMMAKRPGDRYPSAAAAAEALEPYTRGANPAALLDGGGNAPTRSYHGPVPERPRATPSRRRALAAAVLGAAALVALVAGVVLRLQTDRGTLVVQLDGDDLEARVRGKELVLEDKATKRTFTLSLADSEPVRDLPPGEYLIRVEDDTGLSLTTREFVIRRNQRTPVRVTAERAAGAQPVASRFAPLDPDWLARAQALTTEGRLREVAAELKRRNPGHDGRWHNNPEPEIDQGRVVKVSLRSEGLTDLTPLRALPELAELSLHTVADGTEEKADLLEDLRPLAGLKLTALNLFHTRVTDLAPLKGMPLRQLCLDGAKLTDLSPLRDVPVEILILRHTPLSDLSPLRGHRHLKHLYLTAEGVTDLSPLRGLELRYFAATYGRLEDLSPLRDVKLTEYVELDGSRVTDLSPLRGQPLKGVYLTGLGAIDLAPLRGMPLEDISLDFTPAKHREVLRSLKGLKTINEKPARQFWAQYGK